MVTNIYWHWEGALSKQFCDSMLAEINWSNPEIAGVGDNSISERIIDLSKRRTDVMWQDCMQPLGCVARTYIEVANQVANWQYILTGQEATQIGRYKSSDEGHYDWHMDASPPKEGIQRKLSISILLTDPSEFEGGELQFKNAEDKKVLTKQGSIIVFPSFIEHRVTPVTKGVRHSAVTWASGPTFK
jgi:PKHD-type hydroxylase